MKIGITVQKITELAKLLPALLQGRVFCCLKLNIFLKSWQGVYLTANCAVDAQNN